MSATDQRTRKRGVRASRARLNHALSEAGFKTQTAVAERIADLEGLDAAPKDLVNRVFREQPVEPRSLERVAQALGVEASTLYLSSKTTTPATEVLPSEPMAKVAAAPRHLLTRRRMTASLATILLLTAAAVWGLSADMPLGCRAHEYIHPLKTTQGRLGILIARFQHDPDNAAQYFLASSFASDRRLRPYISVLMTCHTLALKDSGNADLQFEALRARGRWLLRHTGAAMLLWGRAYNGRLLVRFISSRQHTGPVTMQFKDRSLPVDASRLQIFS